MKHDLDSYRKGDLVRVCVNHSDLHVYTCMSLTNPKTEKQHEQFIIVLVQTGTVMIVERARSSPVINGAKRPGYSKVLDPLTGVTHWIERRHLKRM